VRVAEAQVNEERLQLEQELGEAHAEAEAVEAELRSEEKTRRQVEKRLNAAKQRVEATMSECQFLRDLNAQMIRDRERGAPVEVKVEEDAYVERLRAEVALLMAQLD